MTTPPPGGPPPAGPPPGPAAEGPDPARRLRLVRNIIIAVIAVIAVFALIASCATSAGSGDARRYVQSTYQRDASLDESNVTAYVAKGSPTTVADQIANVERPNDIRDGDTSAAGNVAGTRFLQYPDYLIALFPYGFNQTRVMVSRDYRSGYNHYIGYVGPFWVPTPGYSGSGSGNRGGGSGGGGK
ncbi:hypothetical protein GCM10009624_26790 [Gordonia sinesedis]